MQKIMIKNAYNVNKYKKYKKNIIKINDFFEIFLLNFSNNLANKRFWSRKTILKLIIYRAYSWWAKIQIIFYQNFTLLVKIKSLKNKVKINKTGSFVS